MVLMKSACADKARFRSGNNGVLLLTYGRDDSTKAVLLPAKSTLAEALATHRALPKEVGFGLRQGIRHPLSRRARSHCSSGRQARPRQGLR